jgi:hypothetical protein
VVWNWIIFVTHPDLSRVEGPNLILRLIQPDDAAYVHGLRVSPLYNQHLSEVRGGVEDQRRWIESHKAREAEGREFYYIITRKDGTACGAVRLYDLENDSFTWGSWILDANKPAKAALESAVLIYSIAFDLLSLSSARFDVRRDNETTLAFHRRFGAKQTSETSTDIFFTYPRSRYQADRDSHLAVLRGQEHL